MKVNLDTVIKDINDAEDMKLQGGEPATLRVLIQQALGAVLESDRQMSDEDKYKLFRLGRRCKAEEAHFSAAEVTLILGRVSKFFLSAYVYGQVKDLLDPPADEARPYVNGSAQAAI